MTRTILFLLKRRLIVYLITSLIVIAGLGSLFSFPIELVPKTNLPWIVLNISGGSLPPEEMEERVTKKVEQELKALVEIKEFSSTTSMGRVRIMIVAQEGQGERVKQEVQAIANRLRNDFPAGVDTIDVRQDNLGTEALVDYALVGSDPQTMLNLAKTTIKERIEAVPGVREVVIPDSDTQAKIAVTFLPERLNAYQMTPAGVIDQLRTSNWKQAVGTLENTGFDTVVMFDQTYSTVPEIKQLLIDTPKGSVPLAQLAAVEDLRGVEQDFTRLTDGQVFVYLSLARAEGSDLIETQAKVEEVVRQINAEANGQYELRVMIEAASFINNAVSNLSRDVVLGGVLAIAILFLFLRNWRVTLVIATTLPLSALMTFIAMKLGGYNLDLVTLISLSLSVGLIVDAAIVVLESIYHFREKGEELRDAIVKGTKEVITPVFTSQLTLVVVFLPLVLADFEDWLQPILATIAFTVTSAIVASTVAAFFFVPIFSERFLQKDKNISLEKERKDSLIVRAFQRVLSVALRHRKKSLLAAVALFVAAGAMLPYVKMGQGMDVNENLVFATMEFPRGTDLAGAKQLSLQAEQQLRELPEVKDVFSFVGETEAELFIALKGKKERSKGKEELTEAINERLKSLPGVENITTAYGGQGAEAPIQLDIKGDEIETMATVAADVEAMLAAIPGITNIRNDIESGQEKVTLVPRREALARMQVDPQSLLQQVAVMMGEQAITTVTQEGIELDVVARMPQQWLKHPEQLRQIMIVARDGIQVPLHELVDVTYGKTPVAISREQGQKVSTVYAELSGIDLGTAGRAIAESLPSVVVPAGYQVEIAGKLKEQSANLTQGLFVFAGVIALIYVIMVAQFGRLSQPLIIMLTIPMALVGVVIGFVLTQRIFGEMAMIGMIMLIGIVVSNAILLIDRINLLRSRGMELTPAIVQGTKDRVRPVIMTKLTAILGMLPMALAMAEGSDLEAPLATAVISGLIFHTLVTLVLVPVLYSLFEGAKEKRIARRASRSTLVAKPNMAGSLE